MSGEAGFALLHRYRFELALMGFVGWVLLLLLLDMTGLIQKGPDRAPVHTVPPSVTQAEPPPTAPECLTIDGVAICKEPQ